MKVNKIFPSVLIGLSLLFFLGGCELNEEKEVEKNLQEEYVLLRSHDNPIIVPFIKQYLINYLIEVALGAEYGNGIRLLKKWKKPMKLYIGGNPPAFLNPEIDAILTEINTLATDDFYIQKVRDSTQANAYLYIGSALEFTKRYPSASSLVVDNFGLVAVEINTKFEIEKAFFFVDSERAHNREQKHILREEITQGLGLLNDIPYNYYSIFFSGRSETDEYHNDDREIIRLLYHPLMQPGIDSTQIDRVGKQIMGL